MIVLQGADERDKLDPPYIGPTIRLPEEATLRSVPSLPDYDTSQQEHGVLRKYQRAKRRLCDPRFFRAALCAFAAYVVLSVVVAVPLAIVKSREKYQSRTNGPTSMYWVSNPSSTLPLQTLQASNEIRCDLWDSAENSNAPFFSTTHYALPANGLVTIRSNVSYSADTFSGINGTLKVNLNSDSTEENVTFLVDLLSSSLALREQTTVCFTDVGPNRGLTIYVPTELEGDDQLTFSVQVLLPQNSNVNSFITYVPLFEQHFGNIVDKVWFDQLAIEGTNNLIHARGVGAAQLSVKNVLDSIQGSFNATDSLTLDTVRGSISATILLEQLQTSLQPTFLSLDTGYSSIDANITLAFNPKDDWFTPSFVAQVRTFNGAINLGVAHALTLPYSSLNLQVQNALAPSHVQLDTKFQGTFSAQTKLDQATLRNNTSRAAGVSVQIDQKAPGKLTGWMGMGARPSADELRTLKQGHVDIVSSLSPVSLDLG